MNKKTYRFAVVFLSIILILGCMNGCVGTRTSTISGNIPIPSSGIVEEDVFRQLKTENSIAIFSGESNGIKYEWTVFGNDILKSQELDLAVVFNETNEDNSISFELCSDKDFGFRPMFSICLNEKWNAQSASVFLETDGNLNPVCSASITGTAFSILNFAMDETYGRYVIKADEYEKNNNIVYNDKNNINDSNNISLKTTEDHNIKETTAKTEENNVQIFEESENIDIAGDTGNESLSDSARIYSDGSATEQDKYLTDPVPEGRPMPVEPENVQINDSKIMTCTFSIECTTILNNISDLEPEKLDVLPSDGIILDVRTVEFKEGESVYDVLQRICKENKIHMEASWTPIYNSAYVEGINNLYEFDCGNLSGWMYRVNGWYPNYGCSRYQLDEGDVVEWRFTCDLGKDVGCEWMSE